MTTADTKIDVKLMAVSILKERGFAFQGNAAELAPAGKIALSAAEKDIVKTGLAQFGVLTNFNWESGSWYLEKVSAHGNASLMSELKATLSASGMQISEMEPAGRNL